MKSLGLGLIAGIVGILFLCGCSGKDRSARPGTSNSFEKRQRDLPKAPEPVKAPNG